MGVVVEIMVVGTVQDGQLPSGTCPELHHKEGKGNPLRDT